MSDEAGILTKPTVVASAVSLKLLDFWLSDPELSVVRSSKYHPGED